jgi:hypothetical protein
MSNKMRYKIGTTRRRHQTDSLKRYQYTKDYKHPAQFCVEDFLTSPF